MNSSASLTVRPDGVGVVMLDQPGSKANVLTRELWADLDAALDEAAKRPLKGLVIASAKPGIFIAGADLKLLADATGPNDPNVRAFIELGLRVLEKLESLPFPTCAAIDGAALGGGLEVALACDRRYITDNPKTQLGLPEVKLGLIPGWGGTQRLTRKLGLRVASSMIRTGASRNWGVAIFGLASPAGADLWSTISYELGAHSHDWVHARRHKFAPVPDLDPSEATAPIPLLTADSVPLLDSTAVRVATDVMIRGAALPLYDAIKLETEAFMNLAGSPESKRLIAEFFASRKK